MCETLHDLVRKMIKNEKKEADKIAKEMRMNILINRMINKGFTMAEISNITQLDINAIKELQITYKTRSEKYVQNSKWSNGNDNSTAGTRK